MSFSSLILNIPQDVLKIAILINELSGEGYLTQNTISRSASILNYFKISTIHYIWFLPSQL